MSIEKRRKFEDTEVNKCLKAKRDWAKERTELFDSNRELLEELIGAVDSRCKVHNLNQYTSNL